MKLCICDWCEGSGFSGEEPCHECGSSGLVESSGRETSRSPWWMVSPGTNGLPRLPLIEESDE